MYYPAGHSARARGWAQWHGWRRLWVAAGSVAFHVVVLGLIVLSLGAARPEEVARERKREQAVALDFVMLELPAAELEPAPRPEPEPEAAPEPPPPQPELPSLEPPKPELPELEPPKPEPPKVELPPPPEPPKPEPPRPEPPTPEPEISPQPAPEPPRVEPQASVTPAPRPAVVAPEPRPTPEPPRPEPTRPEPPRPEPPRPEPIKPAPVAVDPDKDKADAVVPAPAPAPAAPMADAGGSVFIPPSAVIQPGGGPAGLRSLAYRDPCESKFGKKPKECVDDWRGRVGEMDSMLPRSDAQLAQHFGEHMPTCGLRVGCEGGEWISTNGTRSTGRAPPGSAEDRGVGTPGAGGASSLGGLHTSVGRLGHNPDHRDTGFGD